MNEWIDPEKLLPPKDVRVLVVSAGGVVGIGKRVEEIDVYANLDRSPSVFSTWWSDSGHQYRKVRFWMALPGAPVHALPAATGTRT